jgi:hypothetical protein
LVFFGVRRMDFVVAVKSWSMKKWQPACNVIEESIDSI